MMLIDSDYNPTTGITTEYWMHPGGGKVTVRSYQDVEPAFQAAKIEMNSHNSKSPAVFRRPGLGSKVATIPFGIVEQVLKEQGLNLMNCPGKDLKKFLNDGHNSKMRTARGYL